MTGMSCPHQGEMSCCDLYLVRSISYEILCMDTPYFVLSVPAFPLWGGHPVQCPIFCTKDRQRELNAPVPRLSLPLGPHNRIVVWGLSLLLTTCLPT